MDTDTDIDTCTDTDTATATDTGRDQEDVGNEARPLNARESLQHNVGEDLDMDLDLERHRRALTKTMSAPKYDPSRREKHSCARRYRSMQLSLLAVGSWLEGVGGGLERSSSKSSATH
jgi:hypothetical protein